MTKYESQASARPKPAAPTTCIYIMKSRDEKTAHTAPNTSPGETKDPVETRLLLQPNDVKSESMAPAGLPVSVSGRSPRRTSSWSVHNNLLQDVEAQSVAGTSDTGLKLDSDNEVGLLFRSWSIDRSLPRATVPGHKTPVMCTITMRIHVALYSFSFCQRRRAERV